MLSNRLLPAVPPFPCSKAILILYLYVLLDVFSRYVVGWLVAERESGEHVNTTRQAIATPDTYGGHMEEW